MKLLLLCLGLTLVWAHKKGHDVVKSNFDLSKFSGDWYTILLASDEMEKIEENGNFRIFVEHIQALDSSSMLIKTSVRENGQCSEISVIADETSQDDTYSILYDGYNRLRIIEAVYDEYVLFHNVNFNKGKEFQVMFLHGRTPDLSPEIKTWFGEVCQTYGIPNENILDLTKVDRCLQTRGSY
ncbi:lipocalin Can f 6.0101-like isoform 1-T2 [Hipposideros larvatus]